jgi:peptidoglycan/xylan/chitin deacetylase (PgdA/CDA1 family)
VAVVNRTVLATALDRVGVPKLVMSLRRGVSPWLTVLTYHRVAASDAASELDAGVVDVTPDLLERQLRFLRRWFHPIDMGDLLAFVRARRSLPKNPVLVTFDDGYRDNHDVALPILERHGVRATFFVATDYVERRRPFWWDRVAMVIKRSPHDHIEIDYPEPVRLPLESAQSREAAIMRIVRIVKDRAGLDLDRFVDGLERASGVVLGWDEERRVADQTVMTWTHVAALHRAGMNVQSHTCTHRVLQTLDAEQLAHELRGSRRLLEEVLAEPVRAIAYPVGKRVITAPHIKRAVRDAGYELGFSNGTGINRLSALDPLDARRVSLEISLGDGFFRAMLALPCLGY